METSGRIEDHGDRRRIIGAAAATVGRPRPCVDRETLRSAAVVACCAVAADQVTAEREIRCCKYRQMPRSQGRPLVIVVRRRAVSTLQAVVTDHCFNLRRIGLRDGVHRNPRAAVLLVSGGVDVDLTSVRRHVEIGIGLDGRCRPCRRIEVAQRRAPPASGRRLDQTTQARSAHLAQMSATGRRAVRRTRNTCRQGRRRTSVTIGRDRQA